MKLVSGLLALFITLPIWYFLLYTILLAIHPDRLTWFLFWIYVPFGVLVHTLTELSKDKK